MASSYQQAHQCILNSAGCCCERAKSSRCKPAHAMCSAGSGQNRPPLQRSARLRPKPLTAPNSPTRTRPFQILTGVFWRLRFPKIASTLTPLRLKCLLCEPSASSFMHTEASRHGGVAGTGLTNALWRGSSQEWDGG